MKTVFLFLSFLFVAFTINAEPVLDVTGEPLDANAQYFILSTFRGAAGGGLRPVRAGNSAYPVNVIKGSSDLDSGVPVKFTPVAKIGFVPTDTLLEIKFAKTPQGVSSGNWTAVKDLGETWTVGIGGPQDHEGYETLSGFFKIHNSAFGYTLSFVPYFNTALSGNIGISIEDGKYRRLVVTNENTHTCRFRKVVAPSF